jgi:hypothetical protein
MQAKIRLVNKNEIDPEKWDNCVAKNDNGLIISIPEFFNQALVSHYHWRLRSHPPTTLEFQMGNQIL